MTDPLWDPSVGDAELARLEQALAPLRHQAPLRALPPRRKPRWPYLAGAGVTLAAAAAVLLWARGGSPPPCASTDGFRFQATAGTPRCEGTAARAGWLPVGGWLETGAGDVAHLEVADIGSLDLAADSRLSLVATGPREHRLALAEGALHAKVNAPPRLFVIETPAATAIDLGCEYDLAVGPDGSGTLRVRNGLVELAAGARLTVVPMGAEARIVAGSGPGLPWRSDAPFPLRDAVAAFDAGEPGALDQMLRLAGPRDTMTLWNLLGRVDADDRARVFAAIEAVVPIPAELRGADVAAGDPIAIARLREPLEVYWLIPEMVDP